VRGLVRNDAAATQVEGMCHPGCNSSSQGNEGSEGFDARTGGGGLSNVPLGLYRGSLHVAMMLQLSAPKWSFAEIHPHHTVNTQANTLAAWTCLVSQRQKLAVAAWFCRCTIPPVAFLCCTRSTNQRVCRHAT
jgi:hypothetical protein